MKLGLSKNLFEFKGANASMSDEDLKRRQKLSTQRHRKQSKQENQMWRQHDQANGAQRSSNSAPKNKVEKTTPHQTVKKPVDSSPQQEPQSNTELSPASQRLLDFGERHPEFITHLIDMLVGVREDEELLYPLLDELNEGIWDNVKAVGKQAKTAWKKAGKEMEDEKGPEGVESEIFMKLWKSKEYSTDPKVLGDILKKGGLDDEQIQQAFDSVGIKNDPKTGIDMGKQEGPKGKSTQGELDKNVRNQLQVLIKKVDKSERKELIAQLQQLKKKAGA